MKKVNLLSRAEMKKVMGGYAKIDVCEILLTYADGTTKNKLSFTDGAGNGEANAKADCARYKTGSGAAVKCQYDCGYDGFSATWRPGTAE